MLAGQCDPPAGEPSGMRMTGRRLSRLVASQVLRPRGRTASPFSWYVNVLRSSCWLCGCVFASILSSVSLTKIHRNIPLPGTVEVLLLQSVTNDFKPLNFSDCSRISVTLGAIQTTPLDFPHPGPCHIFNQRLKPMARRMDYQISFLPESHSAAKPAVLGNLWVRVDLFL